MWAYCYPVIILDMLLLLWCRAIELTKQTAIVQMSLQMSRSTFWKDKKENRVSDTLINVLPPPQKKIKKKISKNKTVNAGI